MTKRFDVRLNIAEQALREEVGQRIRLLRTSLDKRVVDWMREYPEFVTTKSKLSQWETGINLPPPLFVMRLCRQYNLSLDFFYFGDGEASIPELAKNPGPTLRRKSQSPAPRE